MQRLQGKSGLTRPLSDCKWSRSEQGKVLDTLYLQLYSWGTERREKADETNENEATGTNLIASSADDSEEGVQMKGIGISNIM